MSNIFIDAPLLACPCPDGVSPEQFQEAFTRFLENLCHLSEFKARCKSIKFWRDERLADVLHSSNCYPFRHSINKAVQSLYEPLEIQIEDAIVLANLLLEKSGVVEGVGNLKDAAVSSCSIENDIFNDRNQEFLEHLCRLVEISLSVMGKNNQFNSNSFIASCGSNTAGLQSRVRYSVDLLEYADGSYIECSDRREVLLPKYWCANSYVRDIDVYDWWSSSCNDGVVEACAAKACFENNGSLEIFDFVRTNLMVGKNFIYSAAGLGFMHDANKIERILKACVDAILDRNLRKSHWLRNGEGPNEPQVKREDWLAWRRDIDYEFHLHYWKLGEQIELADVVVHNCFSITR